MVLPFRIPERQEVDRLTGAEEETGATREVNHGNIADPRRSRAITDAAKAFSQTQLVAGR